MRVNVHPRTKQVQVSEEMRAYLEQKLNRIGKLFREEPSAQVMQNFERGQHIVEVTLNGDGILLRSQERNSDLRAAIDKVVDKLDIQWRKVKNRRDGKRHAHPSPIKTGAEEAAEFANSDGFAPVIARRKKLTLEAMPPEEAARQMELLDHSFFLFLNEETNRIGVLYRRESGGYGLIEPEI